MSSDPRLIKLLQTAMHPSATNGERINALDAFGRIIDRVGGLDAVLGVSANSAAMSVEMESLRAALQQALGENVLLRNERDEANKRNHALKSEKGSTDIPKLSNSEPLIRSGLTGSWQALHRIHERAKSNGYTGTSTKTRQFLDQLVANGSAEFRNAGDHYDVSGSIGWQPISWRSKR